MRVELVAAAVCVAGFVAVTGCSATASTDPAAVTSAGASGSGSPSASGSKQAWIRATHATLTNNTGSAIQVRASTYAGDGDWATLAAGASRSDTGESQWPDSKVIYMFKPTSKLYAGIAMINPDAGYPYTRTCSGTAPCDPEITTESEGYYERETKNILIVRDNVVLVNSTVTRNEDDDNNKNWTVSITKVG
jgi:hypothetical protein